MKYIRFSGRFVMLGCGSIGQGVLPLILRHIHIEPGQLTILTGDERGQEVAREYGIEFNVTPLTRDNYQQQLSPRLGTGDFLLNLSVDVSSVALIVFCTRLARCISTLALSLGLAAIRIRRCRLLSDRITPSANLPWPPLMTSRAGRPRF
jgi:homospermidine synthase